MFAWQFPRIKLNYIILNRCVCVCARILFSRLNAFDFYDKFYEFMSLNVTVLWRKKKSFANIISQFVSSENENPLLVTIDKYHVLEMTTAKITMKSLLFLQSSK